MMFSHGEPRCGVAVGNHDAHGDAGCGVVWHSKVVVGWKMSLGATSRVRLGDWMLDAIEYGSAGELEPGVWLCVFAVRIGGFRHPILEGTTPSEIESLVYLGEMAPTLRSRFSLLLAHLLTLGRWEMIPVLHGLRSFDVILVPSPYTSPIRCKDSKPSMPTIQRRSSRIVPSSHYTLLTQLSSP